MTFKELWNTIYSYILQNNYIFISYIKPVTGINSNIIGHNTNKFNFPLMLIGLQDLQSASFFYFKKFSTENPAFLFSPFNNHINQQTSNNKISFFKINIIIYFQKKRLMINYLMNNSTKKVIDNFLKYLSNVNNLPIENNYYVTSIVSSYDQKSTIKNDYMEQVADKVRIIKKKKSKSQYGLEKIVLSKIKIISKHKSFVLFDFFYNCCQSYPNSFVSLVSSSKIGTWAGASPEILITRDKNNLFKTVSMAGTQWYDDFKLVKNLKLHKISWTQKEIEEQAVISRYIIDCFKTLKIKEYLEEGPFTIKTGNLLHLSSNFMVDLKKYYKKNFIYNMINLLHPTPAVCGIPKKMALSEITKTEKHYRKFYTGYLGVVGVTQEIDIYVNLRCVEIYRDNICFYSGAGINQYSIPEQEWLETEAKISSMISIFKNNLK
jgi:isochorismate synthase